MTNEVPWLLLARNFVGLKEIHGPQSEPEILRMWRDAKLPFSDDETAWCAGFVGAMLERSMVNSTRSASARSYEHWGNDVLNGMPLQIPLGAIVVYSRDPNPAQGHVGFAVGTTVDGDIVTLGGNQADAVSIKPFKQSRLVAARWPVEYEGDLRILVTLPLMSSGPVSTRES